MVDAVVRKWILLAARGVGFQDGWGREVRHRDTLFYAGDDLVALIDLVWMQGEFNTLTCFLTGKDFGKTSGRWSG